MPRVVVDTYLPIDTGGPEASTCKVAQSVSRPVRCFHQTCLHTEPYITHAQALVQLALAMRMVHNETYIWRKRVASRLWKEYPSLSAVPTLNGPLDESLRSGDIIIAPDGRGFGIALFVNTYESTSAILSVRPFLLAPPAW